MFHKCHFFSFIVLEDYYVFSPAFFFPIQNSHHLFLSFFELMSIGCQEGTRRAQNIKYAPKSSVIQLPLHVTVNLVKFQTNNSNDNNVLC